nr:hypothetical protein [uncultured Desulfobulbus sp.]
MKNDGIVKSQKITPRKINVLRTRNVVMIVFLPERQTAKLRHGNATKLTFLAPSALILFASRRTDA